MAGCNLKPCPFCGGNVRFDVAYSYFRDTVIYCDDCPVCGAKMDGGTDDGA